MTNEPDSIETLLLLRKLTRSIADVLREQMKAYLATLSPLLQPRRVFGDYVQGSAKETARHADAAFKELTALHERLVGAKPFSLRTSLTTPLRAMSSTIEIAPMDYAHVVGDEGDRRRVTVRSPLKWVMSYSGYGPGKLKQLLASEQRSAEDLNDFLVNYLVLHVVMTNQRGVCDILNALHFPVTTERVDEFGDLPVTCIGCSVSTRRPADHIIVQSAELSGMDAFEEIVRVEDIDALQDPLKEQLSALVRDHRLGP